MYLFSWELSYLNYVLSGVFVARLVGDLIYLDVVTMEGNKHCITGTTKLFYVNSSTGNTLDPRPSKSNLEATTLVGLLQKISSKFKKGNWNGSDLLYLCFFFFSSLKFTEVWLIIFYWLQLFVKFWSGGLLHILLKMFNLYCHQIHG